MSQFEGYEQRNQHCRDMGFGDYEGYLNSELWRWIRKRFFESLVPRKEGVRDLRRVKCCRACGSDFNLVLHHTEYSLRTLTGNLLNEDSLVPLCHLHHEYIEFENGKKTEILKANWKLFELASDFQTGYRDKDSLKFEDAIQDCESPIEFVHKHRLSEFD
jgi:hypothetical protein